MNDVSINTISNNLTDFRERLSTNLKRYPKVVSALKSIDQNDELKSALSQQDRQDLALLKRLVPELFEDKITGTEPPLAEKMTGSILPKTDITTQNKAQKANLAGILNQGYEKALELGLAPEIRDVNLWGAIRRQAQFPLQKLLEALNVFPRTEAALISQIYRKAAESRETPTIDKFDLSQYDWKEQLKKNINPIETLKQLDIGKKGWKQVGLAAANLGEYKNKSFSDLYKEMYKRTKFAQPIKGTEGWEQGNWWQRLVSGFAGSPADIAGLVSDIAFDPLIYIGGGIAKGSARTGASLADDLVKEGSKILPKGSEVVLTKAGNEAFEQFAKKYPNLQKIINNKIILQGFNTAEGTASYIKNRLVNKFVQSLPDVVTTNKYIDYGGFKVFGDTLIKGSTIAKKTNQLKDTTFGKLFTNLFNENAKIPENLIPYKNALLSAGEAKTKEYINEFANIIKDADKSDLDKIRKYLWTKADIERANNKLGTVLDRIEDLQTSGYQDVLFGKSSKLDVLNRGKSRVENIIKKYTENINKLNLNQKQLGIAENLADFWRKVANEYNETVGKATGDIINAYEFYTPIRYKPSEEVTKFVKRSLVGAEEQPFTKARKITQEQAEKLGLEAKDIIESTQQRLWEQQQKVFRVGFADQIKQFGSKVKKEGYELVKDIPELKDWYIPKEYTKVIKNVNNLFFGDEATNKLIKLYDKGNTIWKRHVLATPGYHFRNFFTDFISGLFEWGLDFYNPKNWIKAIKILRGGNEEIKLGNIVKTADEWKQIFTKTGEFTTQTAVESKLGLKNLGKFGKVEEAISKISPAEASLKFGNVRENLGRAIGGVIEREKGASDIMAAANVKKVFFDYAHSLTPFEKNIVVRAIPFYRWLKNNLRRQVELIFTRTGRYATIPKAMKFVEDISEKPENYPEYSEDYMKDLAMFITPLRQPGLPDWLSNLLNKPKTTQAGLPLMFNPNYGFQDISRINPKDLFSSFSPFIKIPIEIMTNRNIYFGSDIDTGKLLPAPAILNYTLKNLPEEFTNALNLKRDKDGNILITQRQAYALKQIPMYAISARMFPSQQTDNTAYQQLSTLLGIKFIPYDTEKLKEKYFKKYNEELDKLINQFEQTKFTSEEIKEGEGLPSTSQIASIYKDVYNEYLKEKYKDVFQLKELADVLGSNKELDTYIKKQLEPYYKEKDKLKNKTNIELEAMLKEIGINLTIDDILQLIQQKQEQKVGD